MDNNQYRQKQYYCKYCGEFCGNEFKTLLAHLHEKHPIPNRVNICAKCMRPFDKKEEVPSTQKEIEIDF